MKTDGKRIQEIGARLAKMGADTDSNDWPERNQILYTEKNPRLWVMVCDYALTLVPKEGIVRMWLELESINGLRRQKLAMDILSTKLGFVRTLIEKLTDDYPQKKRLLGLWAYHGAMIYHGQGMYEQAAKCHALEVRLATDERSRWLAKFNQQLAIFYASLSEGKTPIDLLDVAVTKALELLSDDSAEDNRWRANILCHYVFCSWLTGKDKEVNSDWAIRYLSYQLPKDLAPAFSHALPVIEAIAAYWDGEYVKAIKLAASDQVKGDADWHGNALLVRLAALRQGHRPTREVLAEINVLGHPLAQAVVRNNLLPK